MRWSWADYRACPVDVRAELLAMLEEEAEARDPNG